MAHDVFISYSTQDKPAADAVCATLEKNGVRCWIAPRDIMPGADWGGSIVHAIRTSRLLLLVFSNNANESNQIKREIETAASAGVTIVPLRIENALPTESFQYFLGNIHWLDALTPPLEKHLQEVSAKVKTILSADSIGSSVASQLPVPAKTATAQPPARSNLLPMIGAIVVVLIGASTVFFLWPRKTIAPPAQARLDPGNQQIAAPAPQSVPAKAETTSFDTHFYYRLTNDFLGPGQSLDVYNAGTSRLKMSTTADSPGQLWKLVDVGGGKYSLRTALSGDGFSLDVVNDGTNESLVLAETGAYSGQAWTLTRQDDATYKLTNDFTGPQKSVDTYSDTHEPCLGSGDSSGQHWKLTPVRELPTNK